MIRRHSVVLQTPDGGIEFHPMKQWLRDNPQHLPEGMHPDTDTSHTLRAALRNQGWRLDVHADQVFVVKPDDNGDTSFVNGVLQTGPDEDEVIEAEEITFGLERDLQSALRANITPLELGLRIADGGKERSTQAGRIDITAADADGTTVVIELKAGTAQPEVIAQVLAYMGAIAASEQTPVRGILVAGDFHKRVVLASRAIPNLTLKKYSFQFRFDPVT